LALLKGYRKAAGKCPKAIGKPLGNSLTLLRRAKDKNDFKYFRD
jgi:hypothetical protein